MVRKYKKQIVAGLIGLIFIGLSILSISVEIPLVGRFFSFIIIFPMAMAFEESDSTRELIMIIYLPLVWLLISFMSYNFLKIFWK
jgi:hypothetical protein